LLVQVRPGRWPIEIHARHPQPLLQLDFAIADAGLACSRKYGVSGHADLAAGSEIEKLTAIDGSQTNLPGEWRHLPAYQVKQG